MAKEKRLKIGDVAPDGLALNVDGQEVNLGSLLRGGPVLLTFLRHFG